MSEETILSSDEQMIEEAFDKLLKSYTASPHRKKVDIITKAFNFARQAHKGVRRLSGEPYIMHPLAVALIASEEMGLGSTSICSALLHDVVEDTDYTIEDIENLFGSKVAQIVDGLTKIAGGIFGEHASAQAENFKKLLLTMNDDIRVILVKICDRLHNMRTLDAQPHNKQYKIAGETLYIYAPLANRLGLNKIKTELENLSFKFEHPDTYNYITHKLSETEKSIGDLFDDFKKPIIEALDAMGVSYVIKARVKSPYSIWTKMQAKHITFEEVYDLLAVRIIYHVDDIKDEIDECFRIYVAINKLYKAHPDRIRDWLNHPKANGYQALHVTLMSNQGRWIEVQIRSERMDDLAEKGFAAHWKYKEGYEGNADGELNSWIGTIKEILDDPQPDAMDFLDAIKLNLFANEIFVFTPKGEIKTMPLGCTALDFAFSIHSFLGTHCIGAKVNHKLVPLSYKLQSGDQVEILTSASQKVRAEWLDVVTTTKARNKIQMALRRENRDLQQKGEVILNAWLEEKGLPLAVSIYDRISNAYNISRDELFIDIAKGGIALDDKLLAAARGKKKGNTWLKLMPFLKTEKKNKEQYDEKGAEKKADKEWNTTETLVINDSNFSAFTYASCCNPIAGDEIIAFASDKDVVVHRRDCSVAQRLKSTYGNRILDAQWNILQGARFNATIQIKGFDRKGILKDVSRVLSDQLDIDIRNINITTSEGIFEGTILVRVLDREEVVSIADNLRRLPDVKEVIML